MTTAPALVPQRSVKTRRIGFRFGADQPLQRHFAGNDIALSHLLAVLSASFPAGEELFIRAVRRYADRIADPVLKEQVKGFIGQEMTHGREHRNLNDALAEMGYPTRIIDELIKRAERLEKFVPPLVPLALTAAAEHGTASLAERVLAEPEVQEYATDPETMSLLNWHAVEELEHKAVAFDVYRAVGGSEPLRIAAGIVAAAFGLVAGLGVTVLSMLGDPYLRRHPARSTRSLLTLYRHPAFRGLPRTLVEYVRPGFHPNDIDTDGVLAEWQERLFGTQGELVGHLK